MKMVEIGTVEGLFRYPVKSMRGEALETAELGWHGLKGDRRLALRRMQDRSGFPWLTATKLSELVLFTPEGAGDGEGFPTHVRTPDGASMTVFSEELAAEIGRRHGALVQMMHLKQGIFDDACISVIASDTIGEISRLAGAAPDVRRFRPNVLVRLSQPAPFQEDRWLGDELTFGESGDGAAISVTMHDVRCSMVNLDPDTAKPSPEVLKTIVRVNQNNAGVYGTVVRV